jgi:hypothetical protein
VPFQLFFIAPLIGNGDKLVAGVYSIAGVTYVTGDVGTNVGIAAGFDALNVTGTIHPIPDVSTAQAAADLVVAYNYLNVLPYNVELMYPAQFGNDLVLTPNTYLMNAAASFNGKQCGFCDPGKWRTFNKHFFKSYPDEWRQGK